MKIEATYGIKLDDIEEARGAIEKTMSLEAEPRENSSLGGDYYKFEGPYGETLLLVKNEDLYDGEPLAGGTDGWKLILMLAGAPENSPFVAALEKIPDVVEKLVSETYE